MPVKANPLYKPKPVIPPAQAMQRVLAGTYGLYLIAHNYHWNVEGETFVGLHELFREQYIELFFAVDKIAERIRALGVYALPFEEESVVTNISRLTSNPLNKEREASLRADRMVRNLIALTNDLIAICRFAKDEALQAGDGETEALLSKRIAAHQKALWKLDSILK